MMHEQARDLAKRIVGLWPAGPNKDEWTDSLARLDHPHAVATIHKLRDEHEDRWLTIATFRKVYASTKSRNDPDPVGDCVTCDNLRWTEAAPRVWPDGRETSQWEPCPTCGPKAGTDRTHARILEWNRRHDTAGAHG